VHPFSVLAVERHPQRLLAIAIVASACAGSALARETAPDPEVDQLRSGFSSTDNFIAEVRMSQDTLGAIELVGNHGIGREELLEIITESLVVGAPVDDERIERVLLELSAHYWDRGYANVKVREPVLTGTHQKALRIELEEGDVFRLGKLSVTGVSNAEMARYVKLVGRRGELFNRTAIAAARERLHEAAQAGDVLPQTKVHLDTKTIDIEFEVTRRLEPGLLRHDLD